MGSGGPASAVIMAPPLLGKPTLRQRERFRLNVNVAPLPIDPPFERPGRIRTIVPVGDDRSRQFEMRVVFESPDWLVGMPIELRLPHCGIAGSLQPPAPVSFNVHLEPGPDGVLPRHPANGYYPAHIRKADRERMAWSPSEQR
jgi:hypothetical protein